MIDENSGMSMMGLSHGEQLVVWGIRKIVVQQGAHPDLPAEFQAPSGLTAPRVTDYFAASSGF